MVLTALARLAGLARENQTRTPTLLIAWDRQRILRRQLPARPGHRRTR
jgi:hypothetical protein